MSVWPIHVALVNVKRRSVVLHGLLQDSPFDIILVQEPWFGKINTARDDLDPDGVDVLGVTANNIWQCFLPDHLPSEICKVATYIRVDLVTRSFIRCRSDMPISSPLSMVVDLMFEDDLLHLYNIYHHVPDKGHGFHCVFAHELDPVVPTLMVGGFNTHGPGWSLPDASLSPWALLLEDWFEDNELLLCNPPGIPTWQGCSDQRPLVINLVLLNSLAVVSDQLTMDVSISFELSLGSDHAMLSLFWTPACALPPLPQSTLLHEPE